MKQDQIKQYKFVLGFLSISMIVLIAISSVTLHVVNKTRKELALANEFVVNWRQSERYKQEIEQLKKEKEEILHAIEEREKKDEQEKRAQKEVASQ